MRWCLPSLALLIATAFLLYAARETMLRATGVHDDDSVALLPRRPMTKAIVLRQPAPSVGFKRLEKDGFGSQFQFQLMGYVWARHYKRCYCHMPQDKMLGVKVAATGVSMVQVKGAETNETNEDMDRFSGLRSDACCDAKHADVVYTYSANTTRTYDVTHKASYLRNLPLMTPNATFNIVLMKYMLTPEIAQEMRRMYFSTPKPKIDTLCHVAFHVRKGDTTPEWQEKEREKAKAHGDFDFSQMDEEVGMIKFTPDEEARKIVSHMRTRFPKERICVFSQGKPADFAFLKPYGVDLRLNGEIREAFHHMVLAPHLVVARQSSMSNAAGILNTGQVYHYCKAEFSEDGRIPLRPCPCIQGDERSMGLSHRLGRVGQGASHRQNFMCFGGDGWGSSSILNLMHWIPLVGERLE